MSLYNMVCGNNPLFALYLAMLDIHEMPTRFRDLYVTVPPADTEPHIVIYTRTGGGNRAGWADDNAKLSAHPLHVRNYDDDFDSTFAHWVFRVPHEYSSDVIHLQMLIAGHPKFYTPKMKFERSMAELEGQPDPHPPKEFTKEEGAEIGRVVAELSARLGLRVKVEPPT